MQIVRDLAGFTMGQSDNVRRAMSKKKPDELARYQNLFIHGGLSDTGQQIDGAIKRGVPQDTAERIWEDVMAFAGYAFNKAHAACYAVVAYHTAWLKLYYPVPFMAAMLNSFLGQLGQAAHYVRVCRDMNIGILQPDINRSQVRFTSEDGQIRFALGAVKNVGTAVLEKLIEDREKEGPFTSFGDFLRRAHQLGMNRKMIESLIKSSALDGFGIPRNQLIAATDPYLNMLSSRKNVMDGQLSFFDFGVPEEAPVEPTYPTLPDLDKAALLTMELEMLGLYVSGHPLDDYRMALTNLVDKRSSELSGAEIADDSSVNEIEVAQARLNLNGKLATMGGLVVKRRNLTTKKGEMMCFIEIEDLEGRFETIVFPKTLSVYRDMIQEGEVLLVTGRISAREDDEPKLLSDQFQYLPTDAEYKEQGLAGQSNYRQARTQSSYQSRQGQRSLAPQVPANDFHAEQPHIPEKRERVYPPEPHLDDMQPDWMAQRQGDIPAAQVERREDVRPLDRVDQRQDIRPPDRIEPETKADPTTEDLAPLSAEDAALLESGMKIEINVDVAVASPEWNSLVATLSAFKGRVPLRIVNRMNTDVEWEQDTTYKVSITEDFLTEVARLCGADAISFVI